MEKKQGQVREAKRLKLNKETILLLRTSELRQAKGGGTDPVAGTCISCAGNPTLACCKPN
jgi:hypothetical protein